MSGDRGFLLVRRGGGVFGIANAAVDGLERRDGGYQVRVAARRAVDGAPDSTGNGALDGAPGTAAGALRADEIVGVVPELVVRPLPPLVAAYWPEASAGWAVWGTLPLVLVDPRHPPSALTPDELDEEIAT